MTLYGRNAADLATVNRGKASATVDAGANAINKLNAQLDGLKSKKRSRYNKRSMTHSPQLKESSKYIADEEERDIGGV